MPCITHIAPKNQPCTNFQKILNNFWEIFAIFYYNIVCSGVTHVVWRGHPYTYLINQIFKKIQSIIKGHLSDKKNLLTCTIWRAIWLSYVPVLTYIHILLQKVAHGHACTKMVKEQINNIQ